MPQVSRETLQGRAAAPTVAAAMAGWICARRAQTGTATIAAAAEAVAQADAEPRGPAG